MNKNHLDPASETLAEKLTRDPDYRVLRAVPKPFTNMPAHGVPPDGKCVAIIDCETTGLNAKTDQIIELAIMLVFVCDKGRVVGHLGPLSWLQDPGIDLNPRITLITGLTNGDLAGQSIDDAFVAKLLGRADLCVASNARFDSAFVERRYPELAGRAWACSLSEIDWSLLGFDGRGQQHLLAQAGWFWDCIVC